MDGREILSHIFPVRVVVGLPDGVAGQDVRGPKTKLLLEQAVEVALVVKSPTLGDLSDAGLAGAAAARSRKQRASRRSRR